MLFERHVWLKPPLSSCLNRTQLRGLGRTLLWRSCTCSVRRAAVWTTGFLRSASPSVDLGRGSSLAQMLWSFLSGNTHPDEQDDPVSAHPWILLRRIPVQAARRRPEGPPVIGRLLSRPCQDDSHSLCEWGQVCHKSDTSTLILCADEVWRGRRSEFCVLWFHRANVAPWSTRSRRRSGAEKEDFLKRDFLKMSSLLSNMTTVAVSGNVSHFPELS